MKAPEHRSAEATPARSPRTLQLIKEALPSVTGVAVFWDAISADQWREANTLAPGLGLKLQGVELRHPPFDFGAALRTSARGQVGALLVLMSPLFFRYRAEIVNAALKGGLPTVSGSSQFTDDGALMTYGANLDDMFRQVALFIDKVIRGTKPAEIPVEQPRKFELAVNVKTAKALGLTFPPSLLLRADRVTE